MITIDGSMGEGGGQILRSSLSLALLTKSPFRIINIRAGRKKPGLLRQHLTAIAAAAEIGGAATDGAETGSAELVFHPEKIQPGSYRFAVGTAGSTTLVLQTILPALMLAGAPSRIVFEGGTHNPSAPPFDFLERTYLPQLARFGPQVTANLVRPGFYPAGGGCIEIDVMPVSRLNTISLMERGSVVGTRVTAHLASLPGDIVERAFAQIVKRMNWPREVFKIVRHREEYGPGFVLVCEAEGAEIVETFSGFGEKGVRSESVANGVVDRLRSYLSVTAPVGEHLADQLLLPLALAGGGEFRTVGLSQHTRTNVEVIERFLPVKFEMTPHSSDGVAVRVNSR